MYRNIKVGLYLTSITKSLGLKKKALEERDPKQTDARDSLVQSIKVVVLQLPSSFDNP